jgi:choline-sulfatase
MKRLNAIGFIISLGLLLVLLGCQESTNRKEEEKEAEPKKTSSISWKYKDHNLLFVSFDALQAAHVSSLGYFRNVTPTIDSIAKRGFSFTNATSVASWTVPASMSWFTGVFPSEHRMVNKFAVYNARIKKPANLKELAPNLITLAQILKQNSYVTGGFTGNAGVSGGFGYEQGFDTYFYEKGIFGSMDRSIPKALDWLKENKDKKFFLFLHGYDIHGQNTPAKGFDYRFVDKDYDQKYTGSELEQETLREEGLERGQLTLRDEDVRFWRAIYDEKIQRTDEKFRRFLAEFDRLGVREKTLLVLTSDHGTEFYEHRRFDHGFTLYQEQIHVPLILQFPGQISGKVIPDRISSIDLMPTILDLLDVTIPEKATKQFHGTSLVPVMKGEATKRDVFSETDYREYTFKRSIITPDHWKFIYTLESKNCELYYLQDDPKETKNLADQEPKRVKELQEKVFDHFKSIGHDLTKRNWEIGLNPVYASQAKDQKK